MNEIFAFEFDGDSLSDKVQKKLTRLATFCLATEGVCKPCYAFLQITDDKEIHQINLEQRNVDKSTDVLSFPAAPFTPSQTAGRREDLLIKQWDPENRACYLGDIIISKEHCAAQAAEFGHSFERELSYLTTHALFHLMGYDHMNEEDKAKMRVLEEAALSKVGISRVSDEELCMQAKEAMTFSYSPYSHFKVGACILTSEGKMYTGCNIENASYGVTNCA